MPPIVSNAKQNAAYAGQRLAVKLQGWIFHGMCKVACLAGPWVPKGANLTCTALLIALLLVRAAGFALPEHMHWQMDGGSENWNKTVFGFCAYLVSIDVFKTIVLNRLPPGHTHEDIDGWYGLISRYFRGQRKGSTRTGGHDALDPAAFQAGVLAASNVKVTDDARKAQCVWMQSVYNCDDWLQPCLSSALSGYGPGQVWMETPDGDHFLSTKRSHTLYMRFYKKSPSDELAVASFAANIVNANAGKFQATDVTVLHSLPGDAPRLQRCPLSDWKEGDQSLWEQCLASVRVAATTMPALFTRDVVNRWIEYGSHLPCSVDATIGDWDTAIQRLRPPSLASAPLPPAPPALNIADAVPITSPIVHDGYTDVQQARAVDVAILGGDAVDPPLYEFNVMELHDWVLAVAPPSRDGACTDSYFCFTHGSEHARLARPCELLRVVKLSHGGKGVRHKLDYQYFKFVSNDSGVFTFEPTGRVNEQPWDATEILIVWRDDDNDAYNGGPYRVPVEQAAQAMRVLERAARLTVKRSGKRSGASARACGNDAATNAAAGALARRSRSKRAAGDDEAAPGASGHGAEGGSKRRK